MEMGLEVKSDWMFKQGILKGKYHCTIDLLFNWFGISCMTTDNFCFYLLNRLIQTSQKGGQWYSDTSPFSIPWHSHFCLPKSPLNFLSMLFAPAQISKNLLFLHQPERSSFVDGHEWDYARKSYWRGKPSTVNLLELTSLDQLLLY